MNWNTKLRNAGGTRHWLTPTLVAGAMALAACGGSSDATPADDATTAETELTEDTPTDDTEAAATTDPDVDSEPAADEAPAEVDAPAETAPGGQRLEVSGGSTEPWSADAICEYTPENDGPASSLWVVENVESDEAEGEITVLEVWPITIEEDSEPSLIGTIVEPNGTLLVVIGADASSDGETLTVLMDVHEGIKTFDDPADYTLTVTCTL